MSDSRLILDEIVPKFTPPDKNWVEEKLQKGLEMFNRKIIVLDDDPTGVQTVHNVSVYTNWSVDSIKAGFAEENSIFFILTNLRGFTSEETANVHREIALNILDVSRRCKKDFMIISRSDSTLRGHYPLETWTLKETIESNSGRHFDGEVILPFFKEGGRFTINNIHYVQYGQYLIPAGETEFASDKTFGYTQSHLGKWIEERSQGRFSAGNVTYISLEDIRSLDIENITAKLLKVSDFNKIVVNAIDYIDVKIFAIALINAMKVGKSFLFRTAAAFTKVMGGVPDRELLLKEELIKGNNRNGGLIIIGSHVKKTFEQLDELKKCSFIEFVEFNQHLVLRPDELKTEIDRVVGICEEHIIAGKTVAVYTRRDRLDIGTGDKDQELRISVKISEAVTNIVRNLKVRPNYIIAKGGITSSDIGTKGLGVEKALVTGQIKPGIPVWIIGNESRYPGMPYIIFPGNVGNKETLKEIAYALQ